MTPASPKPTSTGDEFDMSDTGMTDFLSSGNANVTPYAETSETVLPDWYTNYGMQLLANQNAVMNAPYQTFQGPRVAAFTPQQQQGFQMTGQAAEAYKPGMETATRETNALFSAPGGLQTADPYLRRSAETVEGALSAPGAFATANPFLQRSGATSASQVQQYMDPYQSAVVNRIGELGARTLREQILPEISDRFIKSGQFGGSRQAEMIGRGVRDAMEGISAQQSAALSQGYQGALQAAGADLARFGTLGATAGALTAQDLENRRAAASQLASIGQTSGALQQGDLDARRAAAAQAGNLAAQQQNLGLTGARALQEAGALQQAQEQRNLDVAYEDFMRQQADPQARIDAALGTFKGVAPGVGRGVLEYGFKPSGQPGAETMSDADKALLIAKGATSIIDFFKNP